MVCLDGYLLQLTDIEKSFGDTKVLKGISLSVSQGEFITLLGKRLYGRSYKRC